MVKRPPSTGNPLPIPIPRPCPGCTARERAIRAAADILAGIGGGIAGGAVGGFYGGPRGALIGSEIGQELAPYVVEEGAMTVKRKATAYQKRYGKAFKKIKKDYLKRKGGWKKGGYRRAVKHAHRIAKRGKK